MSNIISKKDFLEKLSGIATNRQKLVELYDIFCDYFNEIVTNTGSVLTTIDNKILDYDNSIEIFDEVKGSLIDHAKLKKLMLIFELGVLNNVKISNKETFKERIVSALKQADQFVAFDTKIQLEEKTITFNDLKEHQGQYGIIKESFSLLKYLKNNRLKEVRVFIKEDHCIDAYDMKYIAKIRETRFFTPPASTRFFPSKPYHFRELLKYYVVTDYYEASFRDEDDILNDIFDKYGSDKAYSAHLHITQFSKTVRKCLNENKTVGKIADSVEGIRVFDFKRTSKNATQLSIDRAEYVLNRARLHFKAGIWGRCKELDAIEHVDCTEDSNATLKNVYPRQTGKLTFIQALNKRLKIRADLPHHRNVSFRYGTATHNGTIIYPDHDERCLELYYFKVVNNNEL